jgi:hypothetical protein
MTLRRVVAYTFFLTCCFASMFSAQTVFALSACQCTCSDVSATDQLLTDATVGSDYMATCRANNVCGTRELVNAFNYMFTGTAGVQVQRTACECSTPIISVLFSKQVSGDTTCSNTCETTCRNEGSSVKVQSAEATKGSCITDADCKTGVFAKYKGVTCKSAKNEKTGKISYACDIPVTGADGKANANIECANYGGTGMKGSTCDFVASGDDPSSYVISRPYFTNAMTYAWITPNISKDTTVQELWSDLENDRPSIPGICHLYGLAQSDYSSMDVTALLAQAAVNASSEALGGDWGTAFAGSKKYVCMKRKLSACGTVNVPQDEVTPIVKNSMRYSCIDQSTASTKGKTSDYCLNAGTYTSDSGATVKKEDLCAIDGDLCCAFGCTLDAECGSFKKCDDGKCVPDSECNPDDSTWACRSASSAEKSNEDICLRSILKPLCQTSSQSCCAPIDDDALGNCAADMMNDSDDIFQDGGWKDFGCFGGEMLKQAGIMTISDYKNGGKCILTDVSSTEQKAVKRCGASKSCCKLSATEAGLAGRVAIGGACNNSLNIPATCKLPNQLIGTGSMNMDQVASYVSGLGFGLVNQYLYALASSNLCQATQVVSGSMTNNKECASGSICCLNNFKTCNNDVDCFDIGRCDLSLKVCIPSLVSQPASTAVNCAETAITAGDGTVQSIIETFGGSNQDFACQVVNSADPQTDAKCAIIGGCSTEADGVALAEGEKYRCCVSGVGKTPAAVAATPPAQTKFTETAKASQSSIGLSSCVASGQCTLNDLLVTGANFANFLILISGSIFLAIFVYAGYKYLFAGASNKGADGLKMIKQATTGLILMFAGYLLINFIQSSFISSVYDAEIDACGTTEATANMTCQFVSDVEASKNKGCVTSMCNGPENRICCPFGANK